MKNAELRLGRIVIGEGISKKVSLQFLSDCLERHWKGDSGDASREDKQTKKILQKQGWIWSVYRYKKRKLWIFTEPDGSFTLVLLEGTLNERRRQEEIIKAYWHIAD